MMDANEKMAMGIGVLVGLLIAVVLTIAANPEHRGAAKLFSGEIKCEQLDNKQVVCYSVN